jgi:hypothetical protein
MDTSSVLLGLAIALVVIWLYEQAQARSGFVSKEAQVLHTKAKDLFDKTSGAVPYASFREATRADPVTYTDTRKLWRAGTLTPEAVQSVM